MTTLNEQYKQTKTTLESLREQILEESPVIKDTLIRDELSGKYLRVRYVMVDDEGDLSISTTSIKNEKINWQSCSDPRYTSSTGLNFEVVNWVFDQDKVEELQGRIETTDSVSEKGTLQGELRQLYYDCKHNWVNESGGWGQDDYYQCTECGSCTYKTGDDYNIDLDWITEM